jgi:hypothetical protein
VGADEAVLWGAAEATVKYHSRDTDRLTPGLTSGRGTVPGGQFDWGGRLPKSNGGAQRYPQGGRTSPGEACKGGRVLDCEAHRPSRDESRA